MTEVPNPVSIEQLRQLYDRAVQVSDATTNAEVWLVEHYRSLRLVCSLLCSVAPDRSDLVAVWNETAYRACLLESYVIQACGGSEGEQNDGESLIPVETEQSENRQWSWRVSSQPKQIEGVLTMNRTELMEEEASLLQMANTPIPEQNERIDASKALLLQRIRQEWN